MNRYVVTASLVRDEGDWAIVCNGCGNLISVNEMGKLILQLLCKKTLTLSQLIENLRDKIDTSQFALEELENAVSDFLDDMIQEKIVSDDVNSTENCSTSKILCLKHDSSKGGEMFLNSPLSAIIMLTNRCNQKCEFCYIDPRYSDSNKSELQLEQLYSICDILMQQGVVTLNILGGEPLARYEDLISIITYMEEKFPWCHCSFATNGTCGGGITKERAIQLKKFKNFSMRVSLHGLEEYHDEIVGVKGAYKAATESIKNIHKYAPDVRLSVNAVLNEYLSKNYEKFIDELFLKYDVDNIEFAPLQYVGCANLNKMNVNKECEREALIELKKLRTKWLADGKVILYGGRYTSDAPVFRLKNESISCALKQQVVIDTKGDCYFCHMTTGMKAFCGGNIFRDTFTEIWRSKVHKQLISALTDHNDICSRCSNFETCQGGCKMSGFLRNGKWNSLDASCPYHSYEEEVHLNEQTEKAIL